MVLSDGKPPAFAVRSFAGVGEFLVFLKDRHFLGELWVVVCFSGDEVFNKGSAILLEDELCGKNERLCSSSTVSMFVPAWQPLSDSETTVGGTTAVAGCCFGVCILDDCSSPFEDTASELGAAVLETEKCSSPIGFLPSRVTAADSEVSINTSKHSVSTSLETTRFCDPAFSTSPATCCDWRGVIGLKKDELSSLGLNIVTLPFTLLSPVRCATRGCDG